MSNPPVRFQRGAVALALFFLSCFAPIFCQAQNRDVICRDGDGDFISVFRTGVKVHVGAARNGLMATRVCSATLTWNDQNLVIASAASELDVDAFGVDLGAGAPVVAFQVKKSAAECCMEYKIYSLREPPILLRSISGGTFFSAADTDLDGRVEIWTDDAAALAGFENINLSDLNFAPPLVLRFTRGRLLNASAEFQPYFDQKIAEVRAMLDLHDLDDFKNSDGKLTSSAAFPAVRLVQLRSVKIKVLEIVWSYLYSGREQQAWFSLADMWPSADVDRIRAALLSARARGIRAQVDGVSTTVRAGHKIHAKIFDATTHTSPTPGMTPKDAKVEVEIEKPRAILMERPRPSTDLELGLAKSESLLELVIDSAGKVRSVQVMGNPEGADAKLLSSSSQWKFIPAFSGDQPVASRILLGVSLKQ